MNGGIHKKNDEIKGNCANGGAGTVFNAEKDLLLVDNRNISTSAATTLVIPKSKQHNSEKGISELARGFVVTGKSNVMIKGEHYGLTFDFVRVDSHSIVEFGQ